MKERKFTSQVMIYLGSELYARPQNHNEIQQKIPFVHSIQDAQKQTQNIIHN